MNHLREPLRGLRYFVGNERVARVVPNCCDVGACLSEDFRQTIRQSSRDNLILPSRRDPNPPSCQSDGARRFERDHRTKQNRSGQHHRPGQQQAGRDVGAVRIPDGEQPCRIEPVVARRRLDEISKLDRPAREIFEIEDPFFDSTEIARHAVLENASSRAQDGCVWIDSLRERQQVVLVAPRAVQHEQRRARVSAAGT